MEHRAKNDSKKRTKLDSMANEETWSAKGLASSKWMVFCGYLGTQTSREKRQRLDIPSNNQYLAEKLFLGHPWRVS
jgi:hypothetical protein